MGEPRGEVAVVGEQQQPFAVVVEAADRVDVLAHAAEQVDHRAAPLRIRSRGDVARRACSAGCSDGARRLRTRRPSTRMSSAAGSALTPISRIVWPLTRHASLGDQLLRRAPRRDAGLREDLLESYHYTLDAH